MRAIGGHREVRRDRPARHLAHRSRARASGRRRCARRSPCRRRTCARAGSTSRRPRASRSSGSRRRPRAPPARACPRAAPPRGSAAAPASSRRSLKPRTANVSYSWLIFWCRERRAQEAHRVARVLERLLERPRVLVRDDVLGRAAEPDHEAPGRGLRERRSAHREHRRAARLHGSRRSRAAASAPTATRARAARSRRGPAPRSSRRRCSRAPRARFTKRSCSSSGSVWSGIVMPSRANGGPPRRAKLAQRGGACALEPLPCARNGSRSPARTSARAEEAAQAGAGDRAARDHRGRAERAAHAAPDLDARPRAREHVRADRRARRRGGRPGPAHAGQLEGDPGPPCAGGARSRSTSTP